MLSLCRNKVHYIVVELCIAKFYSAVHLMGGPLKAVAIKLINFAAFVFIVKYKHHRYYPVTFFKYTRQESVEILRFNWVFWAIQIREWTILLTKGLTSVTSLGPKNLKKVCEI